MSDPAARPSARIDAYLKRLRTRYIAGRVLAILTVALIVDLVVDVATLTLFNLWGIKVSIPFLFEILLVVLLVRDRRSWDLEEVGVRLDRRFSLKERLYSHVWYSRHREVPAATRQALAKEVWSAVDFPRILREARVRVPVLLPVALFLFGGLLYLSWNSDYRPGGITTRIVMQTVQRSGDGTDRVGPAQSEGETGLVPLPEDHGAGPGIEQGEAGAGEDREAAPDRTRPESGEEQTGALSPGEAGDAPVEEEGAAPSSAGGPGGAGGEGSARTMVQPDNLVSNPLTQSVSEPIPPSLSRDPSVMFRELPEATKFLSLVPGQGGQALAPLDDQTVSNFEDGIDRFPEIYREQLQTYYRELKKWNETP